MRLDLQPVVAAAAFPVGALAVLGDDAFQPCCHGGLEKRDPVLSTCSLRCTFRQLGDEALQQLLSFAQRQLAQVTAIEVEKIEDVVDQVALAGLLVVLQELEVRPALGRRATTISPSSTARGRGVSSDSTIGANLLLERLVVA